MLVAGDALAEPLAQERQHVVRLRVAADHLLLEDELVVDMHVEDAVLARDDLDARDLALELVEDPRRQTDGVRQRASGDAVLDADLMLAGHGADAIRPAFGHSFAGC